MADTELASWRDTATRKAIVDFVAAVTEGDEAIPVEERVAVFDNDGTLWSEKPMPVQLHFIVERWRAMAEADPALATRQPYLAATTGDFAWLGKAIDKHYAGDDSDLKVIIEALILSSAGESVEQYAGEVAAFYSSARHPVLGVPYREAIYRPMLELLRYLESHGFTCYIASGGDRDFMRPMTAEYYGIPAERVIGSALGLSWVDGADGGSVVYGTSFSFMDDGPEKPVRIWTRTGRRPVFAAGNSNGDIPMLTFVEGHPRHLSLLVHHDDTGRGDQQYDAGAELALTAADARGWSVVSVRDDWSHVFGDGVAVAESLA